MLFFKFHCSEYFCEISTSSNLAVLQLIAFSNYYRLTTMATGSCWKKKPLWTSLPSLLLTSSSATLPKLVMRSPLRYSDHLLFSCWRISFFKSGQLDGTCPMFYIAFSLSKLQSTSCLFRSVFYTEPHKLQTLPKDLVPSLSSLFLSSCPYSAHTCTACLILGHSFVLSALPPFLFPSSGLFLSPLPIRCSICSISFWAREWGDPNLEHIEVPSLSLSLFFLLSLFNSFTYAWHHF